MVGSFNPANPVLRVKSRSLVALHQQCYWAWWQRSVSHIVPKSTLEYGICFQNVLQHHRTKKSLSPWVLKHKYSFTCSDETGCVWKWSTNGLRSYYWETNRQVDYTPWPASAGQIYFVDRIYCSVNQWSMLLVLSRYSSSCDSLNLIMETTGQKRTQNLPDNAMIGYLRWINSAS